jgi:RimJ/RimL family protein N-acetyltransferase
MMDCPVDHPELPRLFNPHVPNNPALWAVFEGRHAGRALVDDLNHPTQCVLRSEAVLTYSSQRVSREFLADAIGHFRKSGQIWLIRSQGDTPAPECYRTLPRLEFYEIDPQSPVLAELRNRLPAGFWMCPIDRPLLERCAWRDDMAFYCGSLENFLKNDLGMCLMHGEEIIVEAYASAHGSPYAEIGAITHEPYRGKGYAPIAVATLIDRLEQRGYQAYWSCDVDNPASASVARKLGFKVERPYEIWEYQPAPVS